MRSSRAPSGRSRPPSARKPTRSRTDRCFVLPPGAEEGGRILLAGEEFHHCVRVSRARPGDVVTFLDGRGAILEARLARVGARDATFEVIARREAPALPAVDIALGFVKAPRFDLAVEKCTELGVRRLVPFLSERCVRRPLERGDEAWAARMRRKSAAASTQAGRAFFLEIEAPIGFEELLRRFPAYRGIYLGDPDAGGAGAIAPAGGGPVLGIVGPEGGLSSLERERLAAAGAVPVSLGRFRLRSETAAMALACRLLAALGPGSGAGERGPGLP